MSLPFDSDESGSKRVSSTAAATSFGVGSELVLSLALASSAPASAVMLLSASFWTPQPVVILLIGLMDV